MKNKSSCRKASPEILRCRRSVFPGAFLPGTHVSAVSWEGMLMSTAVKRYLIKKIQPTYQQNNPKMDFKE